MIMAFRTKKKARAPIEVRVADDLQVSGKLNRDLAEDVRHHLQDNRFTELVVLPAKAGERSALASARTKRELTTSFIEGQGLVVHTTKKATSKAQSVTIRLSREGDEVVILSATASPTQGLVPPTPMELLAVVADPESRDPSAMDFAASIAFWVCWVRGDV